MEERQVELDLVGVRVELPSNQPVVVLRGAEPGTESMHVAIMVGSVEAAAVAKGMSQKTPPRPMTHDLLADALRGLGGGVTSVEIGLLNSSTYFGLITLAQGRILDARASDAIAVAARVRCPLTMSYRTLEAVAVTPRFTAAGSAASSSSGSTDRGPISEDEISEFRKQLEGAEPDDFNESS